MFRSCIVLINSENSFYNLIRYCSTKQPLIQCKRLRFNYRGEGVNKKIKMPLASSGWFHKKSKGDYFTINARSLEDERNRKTFADLGLVPEILTVLSDKNIRSPAMVQKLAIPILFSGKNSIIAAETGCGKTLAYLLPLLQQISYWKTFIKNDLNSPLAIIISPNRELARQLMEVAIPYCEKLSLSCELVTGGHTKREIKNASFDEVDLLIASFGALSKMVTCNVYKVKNVHHVVLDEADTLLDDSFNEKLRRFLNKISFQYQMSTPPNGSQLTLVSATMPHNITEQLSNIIDVDSLEKVATTYLHKILPTIKQRFLRISKSQKPTELLKIIRSDVNKRIPVMIFSKNTETCIWISLFLNENGIKCIDFSSQLSPERRQEQFNLFKTGKYNVISCTDIGSRGLDTIRVKHVLNYDFPIFTADYIHRCGRTGRLGSPKNCVITNLISTKREIALVQAFEMSVRKLKEVPKVDGNTSKLIGKSSQDVVSLIV